MSLEKYTMVYSDVSNKQACSHQNIFVIFQPTQPLPIFLERKAEHMVN